MEIIRNSQIPKISRPTAFSKPKRISIKKHHKIFTPESVICPGKKLVDIIIVTSFDQIDAFLIRSILRMKLAKKNLPNIHIPRSKVNSVSLFDYSSHRTPKVDLSKYLHFLDLYYMSNVSEFCDTRQCEYIKFSDFLVKAKPDNTTVFIPLSPAIRKWCKMTMNRYRHSSSKNIKLARIEDIAPSLIQQVDRPFPHPFGDIPSFDFGDIGIFDYIPDVIEPLTDEIIEYVSATY